YEGHETVIIGAGTVGLLTLAAITATRDRERSGPIIVTARYAEQRGLAKELGADIVCSSDELPRWVRSTTKSMVLGDQLTSGFRHVVDCVGSTESLQQALRVVAPGGEVLLVGMPGNRALERPSLWHREAAIRGCYAYTRNDFAAAIDIVRRFELGRLVSATSPLNGYKAAIAHADSRGRSRTR